MAETTGIAWTDSTFNPWIGCTKVSPGCDHCYAEALDKRHRWGGAEHWGPDVPRHRTSEGLWGHPLAWNAKPFYECLSCHHRFAPPRKEGFITCPECSPLHGKMAGDADEASAVKRVRRRVFCASLADVFDNEVDDRWRVDLFDLIHATQNLDWLILTKRIGLVAKCGAYLYKGFYPPNVWLGASVVNQEEADRDLPKLLSTPAAKRFISYEPALGPIDFTSIPRNDPEHPHPPTYDMADLDWIIVGGESQQGKDVARPFNQDWARSTLRQCRDAGVAFFMKQTGSDYTALYERTQKDRAGADPAEWPEDLRVQEFPA